MAVNVLVGMSQSAEMFAAALSYLNPNEFFVHWSSGATLVDMANPAHAFWVTPSFRGPNAPLASPTVAYVAFDPTGTTNFSADTKLMLDNLVDEYTTITAAHLWVLIGSDDGNPGLSGENGFVSCTRHNEWQDDIALFVTNNPTYLTQGTTQRNLTIRLGPEVVLTQPGDFIDEIGHLRVSGKKKAADQFLTYLGFTGSLASPTVRSVATFVAVDSGNLTPATPAGIAIGDHVEIHVICKGVEAPAAPTNWTLQGTPSVTGTDLAIYSRNGGWQSGDTMPTFASLAGAAGAVAVAYQSVNLGFPYHISPRVQTANVLYADHTAALTIVPVAVDIAVPNCLVVTAVATADDNALAFSAGLSQGFTDRASGTAYEKSTGAAATHHAYMLATKAAATETEAVTQPTFEQTVNGSDGWESSRLVLQGVATLSPLIVRATGNVRTGSIT